ncbi:MAG TPA: hypothetical protein VMA75_02290 [Candidatus Paceibacterota bacterium]|nr:hypothetical protein [Candidatus Paceibacterota bacterium]
MFVPKQSASCTHEEFLLAYTEAFSEFEAFQRYFTATVRGCYISANFSSIKENFELAEQYHKKVVAMLSQLSMRFSKKVENKPLSRWDADERGDNALLRGLQGTVSSMMNNLLTVYRPWLAEAQFVRSKEDAP